MNHWRPHVIFGLLAIVILLPACSDKKEEIVAPALDVSIMPRITCVARDETIDFASVPVFGVPPYTFAWTFGDPAVPNSDQQNPPVSYPNKGVFFVEFTVTDSEGNTATSSTVIKVKDDCNDPVASIDIPSTDISVPLGQTVSFTGSATGGDSPYLYTWTVIPPAGDTVELTGENVVFQFLLAGEWQVQLRVNDNGDDTAHDSMIVTVESFNLTVSIESPENGSVIGVGDPITFSATVTGGSAPKAAAKDATAVEYAWSFGAGSGIPDSIEQNPVVSYATTGDYTVTLTVSDAGATAMASINISITNVVGADVPVGRIEKFIPTPPNFGGSTTPDGGLLLTGLDGAVMLNPTDLSFGSLILTDQRFFGAAIATPSAGPEVIIFYDFSDVFISEYDQGAGSFATPVLLGGGVKGLDVSMFGGDPTADSFVLTTSTGIQFYDLNPTTQAFELSAEFLSTLFPGLLSGLTSAVVRTTGAGILAVSPGQVWIHDGIEGNNASLIGTIGDNPQKLDCLDEVCVVTDLLTDTCAVIGWDQSNNVSIVDSFPTGDSPEGSDLMLLPNGNIACVVAGRNDDTITIAEIAPNGTVISSDILTNPIDCGSPNDAVWVGDGTTNVIVTCLSSSKVFILPSGL